MSTLAACVDLLPVPASVPAARHAALHLMRAWGVPQDTDDAALLVTELVANVVDHVGGATSLTLELVVSDGWLRVAVVDSSATRPEMGDRDRDSIRGRGLLLVQAIADRWGTEEHRGGKRVWFELAPPGM